MTKFVVKTELSNVIPAKDGKFHYNEEIISMKWGPEDKEKSPRKEKKKPKKKKLTNEEQIAKLDSQGRHRSEWCYAAYDGRKELPLPNGLSDK